MARAGRGLLGILSEPSSGQLPEDSDDVARQEEAAEHPVQEASAGLGLGQVQFGCVRRAGPRGPRCAVGCRCLLR